MQNINAENLLMTLDPGFKLSYVLISAIGTSCVAHAVDLGKMELFSRCKARSAQNFQLFFSLKYNPKVVFQKVPIPLLISPTNVLLRY